MGAGASKAWNWFEKETAIGSLEHMSTQIAESLGKMFGGISGSVTNVVENIATFVKWILIIGGAAIGIWALMWITTYAYGIE